LKTTISKISGVKRTSSITYDFSIPIDTSLLSNGYSLKYRIAASDKALVPAYSFSPDSGYYEALYTPTSLLKDNINTFSFSLKQNYPNPFNPNTVILYAMPSASNVKLIVYNTLGQTVKVLENGFKKAGNYSVDFNAADLPSGIYFYRLEAGQFSQVRKMMLVK
jgi:hypothetical protein